MPMRKRKHNRVVDTRVSRLRPGAGMIVSPLDSHVTAQSAAFTGEDWNYDSLGGLRYTPHGWLRGEDAPQMPSPTLTPASIEPWRVLPVVGNHWQRAYYQLGSAADNMSVAESAHTGWPRNSISEGHYAKFMPPPVSLGIQRASRGGNPYRVPLAQDAGTPVVDSYRPTQYSEWTGT